MRPDRDPPRLDESSDPLVRQAIGAARRDLPGDDRMRLLSVGLLGKIGAGGAGGGGGGGAPPEALGPSAGGAGGAAATAAAAVTPGAAKVTGAVLALALAGGAAWYATRPPAPEAAPAVPTPPAAEAAAPAPAASDVPTAAASGVPTFSFEALPTASAQQVGSAPSASASVDAAPGESEMVVLRRAQDTLGSDPAGALALCGAHAQRFPRSSFAQEREVIAIDALVRLGRRSEAEARADRFAQSYPSSGHLRRIDSMLGR